MGPRATRKAVALAGLLLLVAEPAAAERRFAVVIGANHGDADEETLVYAERDAVRIADVLTRFGGVAPDDLVLLRSPDADDVQRVLERLGARVQAVAGDTMLVVYYSGHAASREIHLGGTRLGFRRLTELVKGANASASVLIMDSCRSGALTRIKGGRRAKPFAITPDETLDTKGIAIITSSSANEDAQESERLRGGVFSHHLVNGLLGAADQSGDRKVTLSEMYRYARDQTIRTTSRTRFVQHPTWSLRLDGRGELTLTRLAAAPAMGRLTLSDPGSWLVLEPGATGALVAEVAVDAPTSVLVQPGAYTVRRRTPAAVYEASARVPRGGETAIELAQMTRLPFGRTVRKGTNPHRSSVWSLAAGGEVSSPVLPDSGIGAYGAVGAQLDLRALTLQLRFRYGRAESANAVLSSTHDMFGVDLTLYELFDLPRVPISLGIGLRVGGDWYAQTFATRGEAPDRAGWVWRGAPMVRMEVALGSAATLNIDGGADIYILDLLNDDDVGETTARVAGFGGIGFGFYLP